VQAGPAAYGDGTAGRADVSAQQPTPMETVREVCALGRFLFIDRTSADSGQDVTHPQVEGTASQLNSTLEGSTTSAFTPPVVVTTPAPAVPPVIVVPKPVTSNLDHLCATIYVGWKSVCTGSFHRSD
jgi:hypothetical protein